LKRNQGWKNAVVAIALLGFAAGLLFRLNFLIVILVFLILLSIGHNIAHHFDLLTSILAIIGVQDIAQGSYFLGLVGRSIGGVGEPNQLATATSC
jgi:hypothetical protein